MYRPELIVLVVGIVSALSVLQHVPEIKAKHALAKALYGVGILAAVTMHLLQYSFALGNNREGRRDVEASTAISMFPYTVGDIDTLRITSPEKYMIGYRFFVDKQWDSARSYLEQSIREDRYTAPSYYLLAYMVSHNPDRTLNKTKDWTEALRYLDKAIAYHYEYSPAHYLRAKLHANSNHIEEALAGLASAVNTKYGYIPCRDMNNDSEASMFFGTLLDNEEWHKKFNELRRACGERTGILGTNK
jgi:tetratricopeptide (TPR) repeat protein